MKTCTRCQKNFDPETQGVKNSHGEFCQEQCSRNFILENPAVTADLNNRKYDLLYSDWENTASVRKVA